MSRPTYEERYAAWQRGRFAPAPQPDLTPSKPTAIEMMPMRDGVRLYTEIFLPSRAGRYPVILSRTPYAYGRPSRNDKRPISRHLEAGYAVVVQLVRGQHVSEGTYRMFRDDVNDGYDCIQWIAAQPWCNGSVGMEGSSYVGSTQLLAARGKPPALKCIMPTAFVGNCVRSFPYQGGVPARGVFTQWHTVLGAEDLEKLDATYGDMSVVKHPAWGPAFKKRPLIEAADDVIEGDLLDSWRTCMSHPMDDAWWQSIHMNDEALARLDLPVFFTDGWYDVTIGPIDHFVRLERLRPGRSDRYLLIGPWDHAQTYAAHLHDKDHGARPMPANGGVDLMALRQAFFDRYLKGDVTSRVQSDRVRVYIAGADVWKDLPTFPAPGTACARLFLHSRGRAQSLHGDGTLDWNAPGSEPTDTYVYDPQFPTPTPVEWMGDCRDMEIRCDVLVYTSEPLRTALTILGEAELILYAASDAPDTDWFATLTEVFPDGRSIPFHASTGALRARYHQGFDREAFLKPGEPTRFRISLGPAGHQIAQDNRLRLSLRSAGFPHFDPNTNTGKPASTDTESRIARQTILHDASHASHVLLPLVELEKL